MEIVALPLVQTVESLYVQMLKTQQQLLHMKAATLPEFTVPHVSLCEMAGNSLASATQSLELNTLHMQKSILQLRIKLTPVVTIEKQSLLDIVTPPLTTTIYSLEKYVNCFGKQIASLHKNIAREAGKEAIQGQQSLASPTALQTKKEPSWDETLWQHIVVRAKQILDEGDIAKTVFLACSQMWSAYPQLTLNHFAYVLKKHSIRTDVEKDKILRALETVISNKGQATVSAQAATAVAMPETPAAPVEAPMVIPLIPVQNKADSLALERAVSTTATPALPAQTPTPPVRPSIFTAKPIYYDQRLKVRKAFERVLQAQNLPHETLQERKEQVLSAAITLWEDNPQLTFDQVKRVLRYCLDFTMADIAAMGEVLKLYAPVPSGQVTPHISAEDTPAPPHAPEQTEDCEGDDDGMHR